MLRLLISCGVFASLLSSCINYRYVNTLDSEDVVHTEDSFKFENDDLIISYDFSRGFMEFSVYNKSEKGIFIDWNRSNVTLNDSSFSYYQEDYDLSGLKNISYQGEDADRTSIRVSSMDGPISYLLPGSMRSVKNVKAIVKLMNAAKRATRELIKKEGIKVDKFGYSESPLSIRNNIFYSFDRELEPAQQLSNDFWLSEAALMRSSKYKKFNDTGKQPNAYLLKEQWLSKPVGIAILAAIVTPIVVLAILFKDGIGVIWGPIG